MASSVSLFFLYVTIDLLFFVSLMSFLPRTAMADNYAQSCHSNELSALMQLRQSFLSYSSSAPSFTSPNDKLASWKLHQDCCSWDGVWCEEDTGHVIALDLSNSSTKGSFHPSSLLFPLENLTKLTILNLSDNQFTGEIPMYFANLTKLTILDLSINQFTGEIPSFIGSLTELTQLVLFQNRFTGEIPSSFANLRKLTTLSLSNNKLTGEIPFANLIELTNLELQGNQFTGKIPMYFANLTKLTILDLSINQFKGEIPMYFANLTKLTFLDLSINPFTGEIPSFIGSFTELTYLLLFQNRFTGEIPSSCANLRKLTTLSLSNNQLTGEIPFANLIELTNLDLQGNQFTGEIPSFFGSLAKLVVLNLSANQFTGEIPAFLLKLEQLKVLYLSLNKLVGTMPSQFSNMTQLIILDISYNNLNGSIPSEIFQLENLAVLDMSYNNFSGNIDFDNFHSLKKLARIYLSYNRVSLLVHERERIKEVRKFTELGLASCNLTSFPHFMRNQDQLELIDLSHNSIQGIIPSWILNTSRDTLLHMQLSHNYLTGFEEPLVSCPWRHLLLLDLSFNMIQAPLPHPPLSAVLFSMSNNSFTGNISPLMCTLTSLKVLDLSFNNLSGAIPACIGTLGRSLSVLNLQNNNLQGIIHRTTWAKGCKLKMINLSKNKFDGVLPTSLANCGELESIDVSDNMMRGTFPLWLGSLSKMKILILRSNKFHGIIGTNATFQSLNIFDISGNNFTGMLPSKVFESLGAMNNVNANNLSQYMYLTYTTETPNSISSFDVYYSMRMSNKATMAWYQKILESLIAIDVSSNGFEGGVPKSIGNIKNLYLLNLSSNALSGPIPSSLSNLTRLEALDLSHNKLSGEIPDQLGQLSFIAFFDVSHNHLMGRIPQGTQFDTFNSSWFEGNSGLCGSQLAEKCGKNVPLPSPPSTDNEEDKESSGILWVIVAMGYAGGLVTGVIGGNAMSPRIQYWISRMIRKRKQPKGKNRRGLQLN